MKLPDRLDDPNVRRWAPVGALAAAALLAFAVPGRQHQLIDAAIDTGAARAATDVTEPAASTEPATPAENPTVDQPASPRPTVAPPLVAPTDGEEASPPPPSPEPTDQGVDAPPLAAPPPTLDQRLRIVKHTWAQRSMWVGTPFADAPDGSLPVAAMVGDPHRISYLQLAGTAPELVLGVYDGDNDRDHLSPTAAVSACRIISQDWVRQDGQSYSSAPTHDPEDCVDGQPSEDGTSWEWDLTALGTRTDTIGVALVSTPGSAGSWQVSFVPEVRT